MNSSSGQNGQTYVRYRDSFSMAIAKNVTIVLLGISINYLNGTFIYTFRKHQVFHHNPRYILFIHLVVNDMIQLTTAITLFVCSYVFYTINTFLCCFILAFAIITSLNSPLNLAAMAVECYIAVCFPLQHPQLCNIKKIYIVIACVWALSLLSFLPDIFYLAATEPARFFTPVLCEPVMLFRNPIIVKKREVTYSVYFVSVWLVLIYTYIQIFLVAKSAKKQQIDAKKARNTIMLHSFQLLLWMSTYMFSPVQKLILTLFPRLYVHFIFVWYILLQILPRFLCPMVYGLRDVMFREYLKKHLSCSATPKVSVHGR
ncbi:LOW QUALITY PROTEIN: adenosine receptor A2b-like [Boleophthalmus pectinirostris]|uniref:LOW QUALITY PROTEIN: adenosine receptor A2b-like n=1 Tax=Boleophthalmus pectinirostris TaxID=150288 RepID=UPI002431B31E|nr:LOW QUALITY PROTEIN: adenosine receptor A2b-like [Boleophthalmus pectinirostris]